MANDEKPAGEVGYRRPPKQHQFKPGHSGNHKGRPKRPPTTYSIMMKVLREPIWITVDGQRKRVTKDEARLMALFNKAASGNLRASAELERQRLMFAPQLAKLAQPPPIDDAKMAEIARELSEELKVLLQAEGLDDDRGADGEA